MAEYAFWLAALTWLGDRAPPLLAGFVGGILGQLVYDLVKRRLGMHE